MSRPWLAVAGMLGALGVALGAFGAHALRTSLAPAALSTYQTGVHYLQIHALALLGCALLLERLPSRPVLRWAAKGFLAGCVLFSGSLVALALTDLRWLGVVTPVGGLAWIAAWLALVFAALQRD